MDGWLEVLDERQDPLLEELRDPPQKDVLKRRGKAKNEPKRKAARSETRKKWLKKHLKYKVKDKGNGIADEGGAAHWAQ